MSLKLKLKNSYLRHRRLLFEYFGSDRYSRPALHHIDRKLGEYINYPGGFFVEAGANDGYKQSNTYYLERFLDWKGILIEPIPELYKKCIKERPNSKVFQCALVPENFQGETVSMLYSGLMSLVKGAQKEPELDYQHAKNGVEKQDNVENIYEVIVPARTLNSLLYDEGVQDIDLLSLDVEGYELNVLRGLDLTFFKPKYILVEEWFQEEIEKYLSVFGYRAICNLSYHDVLYSFMG